MELTLTTPAFLFPAATFLLIAYTNRFLTLGARIRLLHEKYLDHPDETVLSQIISIRKRILLIKYMQALGVFGLFLCVLCMCAIFFSITSLVNILFGASLLCFMASLAISLMEILYSVEALNIELCDIENAINEKRKNNEKRI